MNPETNIVFQEIKRRNKLLDFKDSLIKNLGVPLWDHSIVINSNIHDTIVFVPTRSPESRYINGFIRAEINGEIRINSIRADQYKQFLKESSNGITQNEFVSLMMYLNNKVFKHDIFILTDKDLLQNSINNSSGNRYINLKKTKRGGMQASSSGCELFTVYIDWLEKDAESCTCPNKDNCDWASGCEDCSNLNSSYFNFTTCGGGSGGIGNSLSDVGTWSPAPPPGGGGSSTISEPSGGFILTPNTQQYQDFLQYSLTYPEQLYWDDPDNADYVAPMIRFLVNNVYSIESIESIRLWLQYLQNNSDITTLEFENYFATTIEGGDGTYNSSYWDNPNLFFQTSNLPSFQSFISAFPKIVNSDNSISPMSANNVFQLVGGNMAYQNIQSNPNYRNACAVRGSRALNYSGSEIASSAVTELGDDGKSYILSAKAFNKYMNKKFGTPTYRLAKSEINNDPNVIKTFLRGKNGIYTMVTNGGSFSGHVDLIINGVCLSTAATGNVSRVEFIEIWELQ